MDAVVEQAPLAPGELLPKVDWLSEYRDPDRFQTPGHLKALMLESLQQGASDILIQPGLPVCIEVNGALCALTHREIDDDEVREMLTQCAGRDTAWTDIVSRRPVNGRYEVFDPSELDVRGDKVRHAYRLNVVPINYHGHVSCQIVMRAIKREPPVIHEVGLTEDLARRACPEDGIVYVAGRTGSGKTTTFAALLRFILENDTPIRGNLISHEEPIEYTFDTIASRHSILVQSQIPTHFNDFFEANREAMRRKPGLINIGELRDEQSIRAAIEASQTGHPVFGTVHATDVPAIARRLISRFPVAERATAIFDIVDSARFMMAQTLVPGLKGIRVAARSWLQLDADMRDELMEMTDMGRVTGALRTMMDDGAGWTFAQEADKLLSMKAISEETAHRLRNKA